MQENIKNLTFETRDEFQRKAVATSVISLLVEDVEVSPLVVDGSWGTGKTEFCHKLINLFIEEHVNYQQIYIDAFKADHADQPLMTILAAILKALPDDGRKATLIERALPALRFGLKTGVKAGLGWLLRQDTEVLSDDFDKEVKKAGEKVIDSSVESLLKDHEKADESIGSLQAVLKELAEEQPIIIYVDELDRCRPDFAVSMLESIKHVFDVPNVQFVLVTNSVQLKASINHCYGVGVDAQRYLDKFLGFSFTLPLECNAYGNDKILTSIAHYQSLVQASPVLKDCKLETDACFKFAEVLIRENHLSLREVETFVKHLSIYQILTAEVELRSGRPFGLRLLGILGVYLSAFEPELAMELVRGKVDAPAIMAFLGYDKFPNWNDDTYRIPHEASIVVMVALESTVDKDSFVLDENSNSKWDKHLGCFFPNMGWPPQRGERIKIVAKAINRLQLA